MIVNPEAGITLINTGDLTKGDLIRLDESASTPVAIADPSVTSFVDSRREWFWEVVADNGQVVTAGNGSEIQFIPQQPGDYQVSLDLTDFYKNNLDGTVADDQRPPYRQDCFYRNR